LAPVVVNAPPVVDATLVATVVNAPAVPETSTAMEVKEDEDALLAKLFFKRFGRALPEREKEKEKDNVDKINFVIDLTDKTEEMEDAAPVVVIKTEPIEIDYNANVTNVTNVAKVNKRPVSSRLERLELAKARKAITEFNKSLRKTDVILEKEAPLAAGTSENVIADTNSNMSEDTSVNPVGSVNVNSIETAKQVIAESDRRAEQIIAESDAAIAASQKEFAAQFGDTPLDEFDDDC
jgi:hypothetical protein